MCGACPATPQTPKAADFSDVARALAQRAAAIHSRPLPGFFGNGGGKHAAQVERPGGFN